MTEKKRSRGKPAGHRSKEGLHDRILKLLEQDKKEKMDGRTAFSISKKLAIPDPTIRMYLQDLVSQKKVSSKKVAGMTLYRLHRVVSQN